MSTTNKNAAIKSTVPPHAQFVVLIVNQDDKCIQWLTSLSVSFLSLPPVFRCFRFLLPTFVVANIAPIANVVVHDRTDVLAAGNALGRAGEWESLLDYSQNSYDSSRFGQSLVAAVMQACLLNGETEEAIEVYNRAVEGTAVSGEWQWAGGSQGLDPVVRDLAATPDAIHLFRKAQEEGFQVSVPAVAGVIRSCQEDFDGALFVISKLFSKDTTSWLVSGEDLSFVPVDNKEDSTMDVRKLAAEIPEIYEILTAVMRTCNRHQQFGVGMFTFRLFTMRFGSAHGNDNAETGKAVSKPVVTSDMVQWCVENIGDSELLVATMTAMSGIGSRGDALRLFDAVRDKGIVEITPAAASSRDYIESVSGANTLEGMAWTMAFSVFLRLTRMIGKGKSGRGGEMSKEANEAVKQLVLQAIGKCMKACSNANQPLSGLFLSGQVLPILLDPQRRSTLSSLFFGIDDSENKKATTKLLVSNDTVLTETMRAHRLLNNPAAGLAVYNELDKQAEIPPQAANEFILALLGQGRKEEALRFFHESEAQTPDMFLSIAASYENDANWEGIGDLYRLAWKNQCLTEELGVLTLKSLAEGHAFEGKISLMRRVIKATSSVGGLNSIEWLKRRYWLLKRELGWYFVRILMDWNNPSTANAFELRKAIKEVHDHQLNGTRPEEDLFRALVAYAASPEALEGIIDIVNLDLPRQPSEWSEILHDVILLASKENIWNDPSFVESMVHALLVANSFDAALKVYEDGVARGIGLSRDIAEQLQLKEST